METLPIKVEFKKEQLIVKHKKYSIVKHISFANTNPTHKVELIDKEVKKSFIQLNVMMFGKENYNSKSSLIPLQLRDYNKNISYTLYFKSQFNNTIEKYNIRYVISTYDGIEVLLLDGKKISIYSQLLFIEINE